MPSCCSCNSSGVCKKCACAQAGRSRSNCVPSVRSLCCNQVPFNKTDSTTPDSTKSDFSHYSSKASSEADSAPDTSGCQSSTEECHDLRGESPAATIALTSQRPNHCLNTTTTVLILFDEDLTSTGLSLPPHQSTASTWGQLQGADFMQVVEAAYSEAVHWRQNLVKIPLGHAGKYSMSELAHLFKSYAEASTLEPVALKAAMLLPLLMLQKPSSSSKTKDH